jgi:hypothetical protein
MRGAAAALFLVSGAFAPGCASKLEIPPGEPASREVHTFPYPPIPQGDDEWHREPILTTAAWQHIVVVNHADASLDGKAIAKLLEQQYDFLAGYVGIAPDWIFVHVGNKYPCGMSVASGPNPEMFLQAASIFDTSANYAHEMMHCFMFQFGAMPHWFNESIADAAYADSEIELWHRRGEKELLAQFDRVDNRSYELMQLRIKYGKDYYRKVCARMLARRSECLRTFTHDTPLEERNELLLTILSEAAGEELRPLFTDEFGFNAKRRERQRGY